MDNFGPNTNKSVDIILADLGYNVHALESLPNLERWERIIDAAPDFRDWIRHFQPWFDPTLERVVNAMCYRFNIEFNAEGCI